MSRCFPFPPPGYVKKLKVEDVTLLAKEKDKDVKGKRHKKNKDKDKDKGKKEGKEKSKERRKEKDKDKHRDKDKKNGKKRSRNEKIFEGNHSNVEKAGSNSPESSCAQEPEQRIGFMDDATRSQSVHTANNRNQGKTDLLVDVASRSHGAYWTEANCELHLMANDQRHNFKSKVPKIVLSSGTEQRTMQICKPMENTINKSTEGKDMQKHHKSTRKGEKSKDTFAKRPKGETIMHARKTVGYNGTQIGLHQEIATVQELERRVRDTAGTTGTQTGAKVNVAIQKRVQNSGEVANGNAISFFQSKENPEYGNGSYRLEHGPKENSQSKVPKVSIVHSFKTEERGCTVAGDVDMCKKSPLEGMERSTYCVEGILDDRKKIQYKHENRNKPRNEEGVEEKSADVVKFSKIGQSSSGSINNNRSHIFRMSKKTAEISTGKRKEPEANEIFHDNEMRPSTLQRKIIPPQSSTENGKNLKTATTITLFASKKVPAGGGQKLDGEEQKFNWTVGAQSPPVSMKSSSVSVKHMGAPTRSQPPLGSTKPSTSEKANEEVGVQGSPFRPSKHTLSNIKVHGKTGSQETHLGSTKPPWTGGEVNQTMRAHVSPFITTKAMPHMEKNLETAKPPLTPEKVNMTFGPHGSPPITTTSAQQKEKAFETVCHQESVKPPLIPGEVNGAILSHVPSPVTKKPPSTSRKEKRKDKSSSKPLPPHPDIKYLSQILSVPKMEEVSEFDDTGWLFKSTNKCEMGYGGNEGDQVWAKAVLIESADIYALPYVIPY